MEKMHIDIMLSLMGKYLHKKAVPSVRQAMENTDDSYSLQIANIPFKNPVLVLLASIFWGFFGVDRFLMGDTCTGIVKLSGWLLCEALLTVGLLFLNLFCLIVSGVLFIAMLAWWVADIILMQHMCYVWNYYRILDICKARFTNDIKLANPYLNENLVKTSQVEVLR